MLKIQISALLLLLSGSHGLPLYENKDSLRLEYWMSNLPIEVTKMPISMLSIPGTHNSGSYAITANSPISPDMEFGGLIAIFGIFINTQKEDWAVTQRANLTQQLRAGIRYLDLRIARLYNQSPSKSASNLTEDEESFHLVHGQYANAVKSELKEVRRFLIQHPQEVVILDFQHFHHFNARDYAIFELMLTNIFHGMMMMMPDLKHTRKMPSLAEMWFAQKQVIALGMSKKSSIAGGFLWPRSVVNQPWADTHDPQVLADFLQKYYKRTSKCDGAAFFVYQGVLSPTVDYILTNADESLPVLAERANDVVSNFLDIVMKPCGIFITDFSISLFSDFIVKVVALNYQLQEPNQKLEINWFQRSS